MEFAEQREKQRRLSTPSGANDEIERAAFEEDITIDAKSELAARRRERRRC